MSGLGIRGHLVQSCIRQAGLWAIVVATKDGKTRLLGKSNSSLTPQATRMRQRDGSNHWRIWVRDGIEAKKVLDVARFYPPDQNPRDVIIRTAGRFGVKWRTDGEVLAQAKAAVEHVESVLRERKRGVRCDAQTRKRESFLTLQSVIKQKFFKPLFQQEDLP